MMQQDYRTRDLGRCTLAARGDLVWTPQNSDGQHYYLVEDLLNSKFYRVGTTEYGFISLLDGQTTITEALSLVAKADPNAALSEHEAALICNWLLENGLVHTSESAASGAPLDSPASQEPAAWKRWNPLGFRVPLLHPDRFFAAALPWLGWTLTTRAFAVWIMLATIALYHILGVWSRVLTSFDAVFSPVNWLLLPACWFGLKLVHEFAHGLACKKYGGSVREAGLIFILLLPVSYVDVTSSWRFRSKWHRMLTAAAGMYAEFLIASIAGLFWCYTGPGLANQLCFNVLIMASVTTLLFNANFLMKFDGYYVLSDLLEIPNLYTLAQQLVSSSVLRPFSFATAVPPVLPTTRSKRVFLFCYGVASFCWKTMVCACMIIAATALFHGAGIILAVVAVISWLGAPTARIVARLFRLQREPMSSKFGTAPALGLAAVVALLLLTLVPWPGASRATAVVEYSPLTVVRADSPGFVAKMFARSGLRVKKGQVLAVLRNDELENELADVKCLLEQAAVKSRIYEHNREMASWQAEGKSLESLQKKLLEKQRQVEKLTVRAPASGTVIARNLQTLTGVYVKPGDEILSIGDESEKELQVAIAEEDLAPFKANIGQSLRVRVPGNHAFESCLLRVTPRASLECPHPALSAANGGPLLAKARHSDASDLRDATQDNVLLVPHFVGTVDLTDEQSTRLKSGQIATVAVRSRRETVGHHVYRTVSRWVREKLHQNEA